jgi:hypothetical protein
MGKPRWTERPETFGVTFTPESAARFGALVKQHAHDEFFVFDGKEWFTEYAKYLSAYMDGLFLAGAPDYKWPL